jgi:putative oxidoreductase
VNPIARTVQLAQPLTKLLDFLSPLFDLGVRLYVANVFWKSGVNKLQSWDSTIALFENEYQVPLLSPYAAALLGTGAELLLPVLLAFGLAGRFAAFALSVFNVVAVISYPDLNEVGLKDHIYWGILLLVPLFHGPGKLALDEWLVRRFGR